MTTPPPRIPTVPADRRIPLAGTFNLRDVGGYPAAGGTVRAGLLLRGDALHRLDDSARATLAGLPVRTVVDLREDFEARLSPDALDGTGIAVLRLPVFRFTGDSFGKSPEDLKTVYDHMVDDCGEVLAAAVAHVATATAHPILVHCSAGKDRTGVVVAIILSLLGVSDEVIAEDYHLTSAYLAEEFTQAVEQLQAATGLGQRLNGQALACPPELILATLERMRASHGSIEGYLLAHGLTAQLVAELRRSLIEPLVVEAVVEAAVVEAVAAETAGEPTD
ncbi:tyrosine-protein phosphatase [Catenulispora acidiphila]|uniref:tyrosine-protein phosphatase n=1 Tax=Catenulispora acidiphila TaxID=304895 RepID=UPI001CBD8B0E|nr:tyrosine-protein phosphatase [Catenulispora acidiphila]